MESHSFPEENWQSDLDLSSRGRHLLKTGLWADVEFAFAEKENMIKAHRLILASASPVFEAMLYGPSAEEKSPIPISDVTMEAFNLLLEFIYTDKIEEMTVEKVTMFEDISRKYVIPRLCRACAVSLTKNVTAENALQCYEFGTSVEYQPLIDACVKILRLNTMSVLESENTLTVSIDTLEFMFSCDYLTIHSELDLLTFVEKYAKANEDKKIEGDTQTRSIRRLLQNIRFLALENGELAKHHERLREEGGWGREEITEGMPFARGEPFDLTVEVVHNRFKVDVNGRPFFSYNHRLAFADIRYITVKGDVEINGLSI